MNNTDSLFFYDAIHEGISVLKDNVRRLLGSNESSFFISAKDFGASTIDYRTI
jgi:hypothetical protein